MKTAFAVLSMLLLVSTPAFAGEFHPGFVRQERRIARFDRELARQRAFERFRIARLERGRVLLGRACDRY